MGIGGKNIVDILIGAGNPGEVKYIRDILSKNGYHEGKNNHADRIFMASRKEETGEGDFHIHICLSSSDTYNDFLSLRQFLTKNPDVAADYLAAKQRFANEAGFDRERYKKLKSAYVSDLLKKAKQN